VAAHFHDSDDDDFDDAEDATISSFTVPLDTARFFFPAGLCPSRDERHLLVVDSRAVRHINTSRKVIGMLSGGVHGAGGLFRDHGTGCIWIADTLRHAIRKITPKGELVHVAGSQKGKPGYANGTALAARFREPMAICSNGADAKSSGGSGSSSGNGKADPLLIFVADAGNCCIRMINEKGQVSRLAGVPPEKLLSGTATATASVSSSTASAASQASAGSSVRARAAPVAVDGPLSVATFVRPVCVAFDHGDSSLVVSDAGSHSLRRITTAGLVWTMAGSARKGEAGFVDGPAFLARFRSPHGLAIDQSGRCFIADRDNHAIRVLSPSGLVHTIAGGSGAPGFTNGAGTSARFFGPTALVLDASGALLVADTNNHLLRRIQFVSLPLAAQRELGNTQQLLLREWAEWQARADVRRKVDALATTKLERQVLELRRELAESKKRAEEELAKVRQEQMQIMAQLLSSMQAITSDRGQRL
jgi:sugar lactone lactonase YvrE